MNDYIENLKTEFAKTIDPSTIIRNFLKFSPIPIVMLDTEYKIILWTYPFNTLFNLGGKDLSGLSIYSIEEIKVILAQVLRPNIDSSDLIHIKEVPYEVEVRWWGDGPIISFKNVSIYRDVAEVIEKIPRDYECVHNPRCVLKTALSNIKKAGKAE